MRCVELVTELVSGPLLRASADGPDGFGSAIVLEALWCF